MSELKLSEFIRQNAGTINAFAGSRADLLGLVVHLLRLAESEQASSPPEPAAADRAVLLVIEKARELRADDNNWTKELALYEALDAYDALVAASPDRYPAARPGGDDGRGYEVTSEHRGIAIGILDGTDFTDGPDDGTEVIARALARAEAYGREAARAEMASHPAEVAAPDCYSFADLARWCTVHAKDRRIGCNEYANGKWKVWVEWNDDGVDVGSGPTPEAALVDLCDKLATRHPSSALRPRPEAEVAAPVSMLETVLGPLDGPELDGPAVQFTTADMSAIVSDETEAEVAAPPGERWHRVPQLPLDKSQEHNLPDSDTTVLVSPAPFDGLNSDDYRLVQLEFTDDSEGNGQPYWQEPYGDEHSFDSYPFWMLPAPPKGTP